MYHSLWCTDCDASTMGCMAVHGWLSRGPRGHEYSHCLQSLQDDAHVPCSASISGSTLPRPTNMICGLDHNHDLICEYEIGIFARRPDLPELFQQPRFAAAFNRVQHAFEERNNEVACRDIIVNFCRNGGDHGVTEAFMRDSCHLKRIPLVGAEDDDKEAVRVAGVEVEVNRSVAICKQPQPMSDAFRSFSIALMREMCDDGFDYMTQ